MGGPEKPLSELGRKGYMQFWMARVARTVLAVRSKTSLSVAEVAERCWMLPEDVVVAMKNIGAVEGKKRADGGVVVSKGKVREWIAKNSADMTPPVRDDGFLEKWVPQDGA